MQQPDDVGTRARILSVALPLFAEHGYAGTPVRAVASAAGVNVATLAYHFGDKDGLYAACIERLYEDLARLEVGPPEPGRDPVEHVVACAWRFAREHRTHIRLHHRHLLDRGSHHTAAARWLGPLMSRADPVLAALGADLDPTERRLLVFTAVHLVVRFVLDDPADLAASLGVPVEEVDEVLIRWLAGLVRAVTA